MRARSHPVTPVLSSIAAIAATYAALLFAGPAVWSRPRFVIGALAVAIATLWIEPAVASRGLPPLRSLRGFLWAPAGRIIVIPPGTTVFSGKKYYFRPGTATDEIRVWAGWWNCRTFSGDDTEYVFFERGCSRKAVATAAVL
ncbi:MAG: hypothetical protein JWM27_2064 [Gemmatimonadetes bacterium]|nr:hypothetical protein [Gemmatimonadota bacterium]